MIILTRFRIDSEVELIRPKQVTVFLLESISRAWGRVDMQHAGGVLLSHKSTTRVAGNLVWGFFPAPWAGDDGVLEVGILYGSRGPFPEAVLPKRLGVINPGGTEVVAQCLQQRQT